MTGMADRWWNRGVRGAPWDPWFRIGRLEVTTTVFVLLVAAVSIVVYAVEPGGKPIMSRLALWPESVAAGEAWRNVTWPFSVLSFSIWMFLTLLFFWWFGSDAERQLGRGRFALLILCSTVVMGLSAYALGTLMNRSETFTELQLLSLVLFFLYCLEHPNAPFFFGIRLWVIGVVIAAINVIGEVAARRWVHLLTLVIGTAVTAIIAKTMGMLTTQTAIPTIPTPDLAARRRAREERKRRRARAKSHLSVVPTPSAPSRDRVPTASEQVDDESGMESLSAEERAQLDELSRRRRER